VEAERFSREERDGKDGNVDWVERVDAEERSSGLNCFRNTCSVILEQYQHTV